MTESEFFLKLVEILSGSPSIFASIAFGALLLKKYIINGNLVKYFDFKSREVDSLDALKQSLFQVLQLQQKLYELHERNLKGS